MTPLQYVRCAFCAAEYTRRVETKSWSWIDCCELHYEELVEANEVVWR